MGSFPPPALLSLAYQKLSHNSVFTQSYCSLRSPRIRSVDIGSVQPGKSILFGICVDSLEVQKFGNGPRGMRGCPLGATRRLFLPNAWSVVDMG